MTVRLSNVEREVLWLWESGERFTYVENGNGTRQLTLVPSYTPVNPRTLRSLKRKGLILMSESPAPVRQERL